MSHDETRNKILKTLYQKYYDESLGRSLDTNELLKETFPSDDPSKYYPEVNYLDEKGFIHGEWTSGYSYPKWMRIEEYGIDIVEQSESELRNLHYQRRMKILGWLYQKYFEGETRTINADDIVKETNLGDPDSSEIIQEFNYLQRKGLIDASRYVGRKPITHTKISAYGIDEIETIVEQGLEELSNTTLDKTSDSYFIEIKNEPNRQTRTSKALKLIDNVKPWIEIIAKIAPLIISTA